MNREERAKQFAPFDALKGLHDTLRMKEYEHEKVAQGEISEEKAREISNVILSLKKYDNVELTYYSDGHYHTYSGQISIDFQNQIISLPDLSFPLIDLFDIKKL